jgi:AraC-like DNA-binding protein
MNNYHKYLPVSEDEKRWGLFILNAGFSHIGISDTYPSKDHPSDHHFNWNNGRILQEYQVIYIIRGEGHFESTNCKKQNIKSGTVIMLFPGEWHRYKPDKDIGWDEYFIGISGKIIDNLVHQRFFSLESPIMRIGFNEHFFDVFNDIINKVKLETTGFQAILSGSVLHLLGHLHAILKESHLEDKCFEKTINKAKVMLRANITRNYSPEDVADELEVGYSWFRKTFKIYTGMAPGQYFIQLKIQKAKEMLADPQLTVKSISYTLNFESTDYFSRLFKEKTGLTPIQFRSQLFTKYNFV